MTKKLRTAAVTVRPERNQVTLILSIVNCKNKSLLSFKVLLKLLGFEQNLENSDWDAADTSRI